MSEQKGLLAAIIAACAKSPWLTMIFVTAAVAWGGRSLWNTPVDAIPDLSDVQVVVYTEWPGQSPDLVEDQVTAPLTSVLLSAPQVDVVRGTSAFGASFVYVIFDEGTDPYWARSRVLEILSAARLPEGVNPKLAPDATGVGWVYQYALVDESGTTDLQQLRALQDTQLRLALASVSGVAEVAPIGGFVREYQVDVDPLKLRAHDLMFDDVAEAVDAANGAAGGESIEIAGHENMIRLRAFVDETQDLLDAPIRSEEAGRPLRVGDVATVGVGPAARRGIAELDGRGEVVGGIVVARTGADTRAVIDGVKEKLAELAPGLPKGVQVVTTYDRSDLVDGAVSTLRQTVIEELVLVSVVILVFLLHIRSALIPIATLPAAVLLAFLPMAVQGLSANLMSIGGIAVAVGAMVDASVVLVENVHKRLEHWQRDGSKEPRVDVVIAAMQEVGPSIFFSLVVLTIAFLPVFTLEGTEGRLFHPLAYTKTWSMAAGALLAITLTPALAVLLVRGRIPSEHRHPISRVVVAAYEPVVRIVVRLRWSVLVATAVALLATVPVFTALEGEFMPPLNEGTLLYMPTAPPGISATQATAVLQAMDRKIAEVPEVRHVFGKMGRAESATDPAPLGMAETTVTLAPRSEWRPGLTWGALVGELDRKLRVPGMPNLWWMPIQTRTEMQATGVRTPVGILVFGDDLATIDETARRVRDVAAGIPGTRSAIAERATGAFYLDVEVDRPAAARYGVRVRDVEDAVSMAIGGMSETTTLEKRARYPLRVRVARELREDPDALARVTVDGEHGPVPLGRVAHLVHRTGPDMIRTEDGSLVGVVSVDPGDQALGAYVEEARARLSRLDLPSGTHLGFTGPYRYYERALQRLLWVVPATLLLVAVLIYLNRRSAFETLLVLFAVPCSLIGAIWLLWILGYHLSVAVWVGLIALAGLDAETGMLMLLYLDLSHETAKKEGRLRNFGDLTEAIVDGAARRIRPKLMTVLCAMIGLMPILWSDGPGADVMKRIAAPMVGGLVTSFVLELTVYPAIYAIWKGWRLPRGQTAPG